MDTTSEMFIASKFKFLKNTLAKTKLTTSGITNTINSVTSKTNVDLTKTQNSNKDKKQKIDTTGLSKEQIAELKKQEAEEKKRQKEEKAKKMAELCKPSEKTLKQKKFEVKEKFVNSTPHGKKKDMREPMLDKYNPDAVECAWDAWWSDQKLFEVTLEKAKQYPKDKIFTMLLPPPNVTGTLHLGHTLMGAVEDSLIRWKRMKGYCALWCPGTDHAGISCQSVVEKKLMKEEGKMRKDYTREAFLEKVWEWKNDYGHKIFNQFRKLGVSFDWSRMYFTMDDTRSKAVEEAFIRLFEKGTLYRDKRLVHWCCTLKTAISDAEVEEITINEPKNIKVPGYTKEVEFGVLIDFAYKLKEDPTREIIVSTTRIETMLGDVAVAVHPKDDRYKDLHGKKLIHPFFPEREVVIVTDDVLVDMSFGTGAVKITPAHDYNDFECGKRNNLPMINIMDDFGCINQNGGIFAGQKRYECRVKIQEELKKLGLLRDKKPNKMVLGTCSKTGDIIEPMIKPQWWINCKGVAKRGLEDVKSGKLKIIPDFQIQTWNSFLEEIRDWCVSRQLWWGHRCPAYLVSIKGVIDQPETHNNDHWVAAKSEEEAIEKASKKFNISDKSLISVSQDEDVLDTWFSSALLPLSLFGWPNTDSEEFKIFYPSNVLETGHDILFFWVARMVFFSYLFEDKLPYDTVYLHPIVKDAQGRKMSKSLGNVIDPLNVIDGISLEEIIRQLHTGNLDPKEVKKCEVEKKKEFPEGIPTCGADALRIGLMSYMIQGRNINLDINRVIGYRGFGNKIWNAVTFFLKFAINDTKYNPDLSVVNVNNTKLSFIDRWILNKLSRATLNFDKAFESYSFGDAVQNVYSFWKDNLCDVYIESVKAVFKGNDEEQKELTRNILFYLIDSGLKLLHPITPFITEELYQRTHFEVLLKTNPNADPESINSICIAEFPENVSFINDEIDAQGLLVSDLAHRILGVAPIFTAKEKGSKPKHNLTFVGDSKSVLEFIERENILIATLSKVGSINVSDKRSEFENKEYIKVMIDENTDFYIDLKEFNYDSAKEIKRLESELKEKESLIKDVNLKMSVSGYAENASDLVKKSNLDKLRKYEVEIKKLNICLEKEKANK